ncbi:galactokinase [Brachyspira hyodysenteriae]|uniref:Galactokinase n=1 Tax=Brachyspira hyodysenteriae ATCC 27164 TaxID=1266923 RepID=A0A3B6VSQ5_BRAHO|nr:galactokinase family protein [Brachyspira hyodysenteriae]ANN62398.1 galactokinase [Brachyspira hyodysenteriae ATCC 27164]KLI29040.1 galactokinase [Brachyspira hyodysenteriae]MCZ9923933.1 galactokinase [Brachyspira hyodysenteriae]
MYNISQLKDFLKEKKMDEKFSSIYGGDAYSISEAYSRLSDTIKHFESIEKSQEIYVFSASGRTELSGNHTDHNNGCVLTASINLDKLAVVSKRDDNKIVVYTDYSNTPDIIDINDLNINKDEYGKSNALTRGVCAGIKNKGGNIGGCTVTLNNKVLIGSGLSSSASFESLIGEIQNALYNEDKISKVDIAKIGQYAENVYFGKPCGLMDQMGCSVGGIMSIDFKDNDNPIIEKVEYDFESKGYALMIVDAKGDHSGLTNEYAAIREEMNAVANYFGKKVCREITKKELIDNASKLRAEVGDRAVMRAYHFLEENERVINQINALKKDDINTYIKLMNESGLSSFMYLQNCYSVTSSKNMGVALGLTLTKDFLKGEGACRVHGGGFAGTIQALIPVNKFEEYKKYMNSIFGEGSAVKIRVRQSPVCEI